MRLYIYLFFCLVSSRLAFAQDRIITKENDKIPGKITTTSSHLIRFFNRFTNQPDSIATGLVQELRYNDDSLRVLVIPEVSQNQFSSLSPAEFMEAIYFTDYPLLLQTKTVRYDLSFAPAATGKTARLTTDSKTRLAVWASSFKAHPELSFTITLYWDLAGSATHNQQIAENRASALRSFLLSRGVHPANLTVTARRKADLAGSKASLAQSIEFRCSAVKGISILYAAPYTPSPQPEVPRPGPVQVQSPVAVPVAPSAQVSQTYKPRESVRLPPRSQKRYSVTAYFEGLYTFEPLSADWVDPNTGPGNLQGFGGGLFYTYYLKPRVGLTAQIGYSLWAVRRRYLNEQETVMFTNDQVLGRLSAQVGVRFYATPSVYIQPMAGVQQLTLTSENSATHPFGVNKQEFKSFLGAAGAAVGYKIRRQSLLFDVAAQYYLIPNKAFVGVAQPLHFFGLRLGIGYRPENK
ncbi:OmpA family protein [Spirosoma fluviale]|uniref:OmpA family protein n=1 Tax=Spirosoma fluviale TaxID=1597977 RepID=A0A286FEX1_9BACT|nr:OmpA family protein [Spirosoma fluviale]SOD81529.1 OmpA family protein [Spirosoma fluviale]